MTGTEIFHSNGQTETGAETEYTTLANTPVGIEFLEGKLIDIAVSVSRHAWSVKDLSVLKIRFPKREKYKKSKSQPMKRLYL